MKILLFESKSRVVKMKCAIAIILSVLFQISFTGPLNAQSDPGLLNITTAFDFYSGKVLEEKLYLHTDKSGYQAGELMWFKIYNIDSRFNKPLALSKVAYVELLDNRNKPLLQAKIAMDSGRGGGSLIIPVSLPSGVYRLRSYSHWMKNFSEEGFFHKYITVVNALRPLPNSGAAAKPVYKAMFFPEGGNLVEGIESKLAFKIADQFGNGPTCKGWIMEDGKDSVKRIATLHFGMGSVMFTPASNKNYTAVFNLPDGNTITAPIPVAYKQGHVMQIIEKENSFDITIKSNLPGASQVFIAIHTRLSLKHASVLNLVNGQGVINIPNNVPGEGISTITIFDAAKQPVCERLYFRFPAASPMIAIKTDHSGYQSRKKINLEIQSALKNTAHLSMSVYRIDSLQKSPETGIQNYIWLQSELKGRIESPTFYFSHQPELVRPAIENLLLTQGWRRYDWNKILSGKMPAFVFEPEYHGIILNTRVVDSRNGKPVGGVQTYAGAPGSYTRFVIGTSNDSGYSKMEIPGLSGTSEIVAQTNSLTGDSLYRVDLISPFSEMYTGDTLPPMSITAIDTSDILEQNIATQVQYIYGKENLNRFDTLSVDTTTFYYRADQQYLLDDFTRFTTMEEVLREYVKWLTVRKKDNNFQLTLYDEERKLILDNNPLVLLDGIPVFDLNKLMQYDPLKVRKLDVVHRRYSIGNYSFDGILNFVTYEGNLNQYPLDHNAVVVDYEGLQLQREFYSPDYELSGTELESIPDFRTQLKWVNDIRLFNQQPVVIPFFSSDIKGHFLVVLQGISDKGECLEAQTTFEVGNK